MLRLSSLSPLFLPSFLHDGIESASGPTQMAPRLALSIYLSICGPDISQINLRKAQTRPTPTCPPLPHANGKANDRRKAAKRKGASQGPREGQESEGVEGWGREGESKGPSSGGPHAIPTHVDAIFQRYGVPFVGTKRRNIIRSAPRNALVMLIVDVLGVARWCADLGVASFPVAKLSLLARIWLKISKLGMADKQEIRFGKGERKGSSAGCNEACSQGGAATSGGFEIFHPRQNKHLHVCFMNLYPRA